MKRSINYFAALMVTGLLACVIMVLAACSDTVVGTVFFDIGDNDPSMIVAFGDSISKGLGSTGELGYRRALQELLANNGKIVRVVPEGISGSLSQEGAQRIEIVLEDRKPAVIIILYGTNDEYYGIPKAMYVRDPRQKYITRGNLAFMIDAARQNGTIVLVSTLPPVCSGIRNRERQERNIMALNEEIKNMVKSFRWNDRGVILADIHSVFLKVDPEGRGCSLIGPSGNHPTDEGYSLMADTYYDILKDVNW